MTVLCVPCWWRWRQAGPPSRERRGGHSPQPGSGCIVDRSKRPFETGRGKPLIRIVSRWGLKGIQTQIEEVLSLSSPYFDLRKTLLVAGRGAYSRTMSRALGGVTVSLERGSPVRLSSLLLAIAPLAASLIVPVPQTPFRCSMGVACPLVCVSNTMTRVLYTR